MARRPSESLRCHFDASGLTSWLKCRNQSVSLYYSILRGWPSHSFAKREFRPYVRSWESVGFIAKLGRRRSGSDEPKGSVRQPMIPEASRKENIQSRLFCGPRQHIMRIRHNLRGICRRKASSTRQMVGHLLRLVRCGESTARTPSHLLRLMSSTWYATTPRRE
jgi:hypothetical protein